MTHFFVLLGRHLFFFNPIQVLMIWKDRVTLALLLNELVSSTDLAKLKFSQDRVLVLEWGVCIQSSSCVLLRICTSIWWHWHIIIHFTKIRMGTRLGYSHQCCWWWAPRCCARPACRPSAAHTQVLTLWKDRKTLALLLNELVSSTALAKLKFLQGRVLVLEGGYCKGISFLMDVNICIELQSTSCVHLRICT